MTKFDRLIDEIKDLLFETPAKHENTLRTKLRELVVKFEEKANDSNG